LISAYWLLLLRNRKRPAEKPAFAVEVMFRVKLLGRCATAVYGPGDVAVCGVKRLESCAAGEFDLLEVKLPEFSFLCLANNAAVAFDAGSA
jgi:hypothetical protein